MRTERERVEAAMRSVARRGCNPYDSHPTYVIEYDVKWRSDIRHHHEWLAKRYERIGLVVNEYDMLGLEFNENQELCV